MAPRYPSQDYYEILQVHPKATPAVIKKAYRALLLEVHPDHGGDEATAALITEAYRVLGDPDRRAAYDRHYFARKGATAGEAAPHQPSAPAAEAPPEPPPGSLVMICPSCRTKNRVRSQVLLSVARCSRCGHNLASPIAPPLPNPLKEAALRLAASANARLKTLLATKEAKLALPLAMIIGSSFGLAYTLSDSVGKPEDVIARAESMTEDRRPDLARVVLQKAIAQHPRDARLYEKLGDAYAAQKLYAPAAEQYALALREQPANANLHVLRGEVLVGLGRQAEAEESFQRALRFDPSQTGAMVQLANMSAKRRDLAAAAQYYKRALATRPTAELYYGLGVVQQMDRREREAIESFAKAITADRLHRPSLVSLGTLLMSQGKNDEAAGLLSRAIQLRSADLEVHLRLAQALERTGRTRDAIKAWSDCLALANGKPDVQAVARKALAQLGAPPAP